MKGIVLPQKLLLLRHLKKAAISQLITRQIREFGYQSGATLSKQRKVYSSAFDLKFMKVVEVGNAVDVGPSYPK